MLYRCLCLVSLLLLPAAGAQAQLTLVRATVGSGATNATGGTLALRGTVGQGVTGPVTGGSLTNGQGFWYVVGSSTSGAALALNLRLWLEGPYDGSAAAMAVNLSGVLPETDPYLATETVPSGFFTDNDTGQRVVDWVLLQLRSGDPQNPPMTVEAERAALLLDDGAVVEADGSGDVLFPNLASGSYYVVVRQRNHLAVMSASAINFGAGAGSHDFTGGNAYGTNAQKSLGGSTFGLVAGDADGDGDVFNNDLIDYWLVQAGSSGYQSADFDLDGDVFNNDLVDYWLVNAGRSTTVPPP